MMGYNKGTQKCVGQLPRWSAMVLLFWMVFLGASAQPVNKFADPVIRQIHDFADHRDVEHLLPFLKDENLNYRGEALLCLGSVQALGIGDSIVQAMQVDADGVKMMGAFALGQTGHAGSVPSIRKELETETSELVRGMLFEALGKCGGEEELNWLAEQEPTFQETEGFIQGIFRFGLRGITSVAANEKITTLLESGTSETGRIYASYFLGRYAGMDWLQTQPERILKLYQNEENTLVASNLIKAVIRAMDEEAYPIVRDLLNSDADYRLKVNALNSLALIPWNKISKQVFTQVEGSDPNLSVAAAEAVVRLAVYTDLQQLLNSISKTGNWRSKSLLLGKTLELVYGKASLVKKVEKLILNELEKDPVPMHRAWYLKSLIADPSTYSIVEKELKSAKAPVVATYAVETLTEMRRHANFAAAANELSKSGVHLDDEFLRLFTLAIQSGDVPLVALSAGIFRDPNLAYKGKITDLTFLNNALVRMNHPSKIEAFVELQKTISYLAGLDEPRIGAPVYNHPIDWERVQKIPPRQRIAVLTEKGEFLVQLNVNWCPGTVSAFLELMDQGFFNDKTIHRVVPNFVMQDGCPRGDGWGGPEFTLRSEFSPIPFLEGTFGMASAGKDTEGSQWYVTHSPTPHLDAKYTNFGVVISGMEVVHKLEVGDKIIRIERVDD